MHKLYQSEMKSRLLTFLSCAKESRALLTRLELRKV
jgi:hypothetical protein